MVLWQIEVVASTEEDFRTWDGWVHSRLRQLVMRVEPFVTVRPWPKAVTPPRSADQAGQPVRCFYFMGLKKKAQPVQPGGRASSVNLNTPVQEFKMQARPVLAAPGCRVTQQGVCCLWMRRNSFFAHPLLPHHANWIAAGVGDHSGFHSTKVHCTCCAPF